MSINIIRVDTEYVKVTGALLPVIRERHLQGPHRAWLVLKSADDGSGLMAWTHAVQTLTSVMSQSGAYVNLKAGEGIFWQTCYQRGGIKHLRLHSVTHVADILDMDYVKPVQAEIPAYYLKGTPQQYRAALHSVELASLNRKSVPLARATIQRHTRITRRTQQRYCKQTPDYSKSRVIHRHYNLIQGEKEEYGGVWRPKQLANTYETHCSTRRSRSLKDFNRGCAARHDSREAVSTYAMGRRIYALDDHKANTLRESNPVVFYKMPARRRNRFYKTFTMWAELSDTFPKNVTLLEQSLGESMRATPSGAQRIASKEKNRSPHSLGIDYSGLNQRVEEQRELEYLRLRLFHEQKMNDLDFLAACSVQSRSMKSAAE